MTQTVKVETAPGEESVFITSSGERYVKENNFYSRNKNKFRSCNMRGSNSSKPYEKG